MSFLQSILKRILNLMSSHLFFFCFLVNSAVKVHFVGGGGGMGGGIKFEFFLVLVGGFNFRPGTYNV